MKVPSKAQCGLEVVVLSAHRFLETQHTGSRRPNTQGPEDPTWRQGPGFQAQQDLESPVTQHRVLDTQHLESLETQHMVLDTKHNRTLRVYRTST